MTEKKVRRAIVSVSQKLGLLSFVQGLQELGVEIFSTGGTARALVENQIPVRQISEHTGFPEILGGRVKTLHPKVHGGILARRDRADDLAALAQHGIVPFDLVVCNLYPFESTVQNPETTHTEAIEQIDIGGPCLIRAAAKNSAWVTVITDPAQYAEVLEQLRLRRETTLELRQRLAAEAFRLTARYDRLIADYLSSREPKDLFPQTWSLELRRKEVLRYGENPHQHAALYVQPNYQGPGVTTAQQLSGKELSFNNLLDLDHALALVREFAEPAVAVIKHNNPCGVACAATLAEALRHAWEGDPVSAFGSVLGLNYVVDEKTAETLCELATFVEAIIAPDFDSAPFELLTTRPTWKRSVRLLKTGQWEDARTVGTRSGSRDLVPSPPRPDVSDWDYRCVAGGLLVQTPDTDPDTPEQWTTVTRRPCSNAEFRDLEFAWKVVRHVRSNAIILAKNRSMVGVGAGQMSRVDAVWIAVHKAGPRAQGAVMASDAFFPFRDGIDEAAKAGVTAVIQPGGSRRDEEAIAACNEHDMAMLFTGRRHFLH